MQASEHARAYFGAVGHVAAAIDAGRVDKMARRTKDMGRLSCDLLVKEDLFAPSRADAPGLAEQAPALPRMPNDRSDDLHTLTRRSDVVGGKLVGAGGGLLLRYASNPADTRPAMAAAGASELPFYFEFVGAYFTAYI